MQKFDHGFKLQKIDDSGKPMLVQLKMSNKFIMQTMNNIPQPLRFHAQICVMKDSCVYASLIEKESFGFFDEVEDLLLRFTRN